MNDHTIVRKKHKLPLPEMTIPCDLYQRPRRTTARPYRRIGTGASVGRKQYEAVVNVQLADGTVLVGYPLDRRAPMTRFQARKVLKRYTHMFPNAYCLRSQSLI